MKKRMTTIVITAAIMILGIAQMVQAYCQPQCVQHAREKSGIWTCRVGANGTALDWYACEKKNGRTSSKPKDGAVIIIEYSSTGHALYIKDGKSKGGGEYKLKLSHTNYDGKCSGPESTEATYDKDKKTIKFKSGYLNGKKFKVKGIILK